MRQRPCHAKHLDQTAHPGCTFCLLWVRNRKYREAWGGTWTDADDAAPQGPSLARKAVNFTIALVQHVAAGMPQTPEQTREDREAICRACVGPGGFYDAESGTCLHPRCGCKVSRKSAWLGQRCPLAKW